MLFALAIVIYFVTVADPANFGLPNLYHGRDLNRAFDLYFNHKMIWHGPELTGGGQLPGPFYYFLLGLPLWLFGSYTAVLIFQYGLAALSAALIWRFAARYSPSGGMLAYFHFLASPFLFSLLLISWNPTFLPLFSILTIILLSQLQNGRALFWGGVVLGLSLQIHLMQLVFLGGIIAALCLESAPAKIKLKRMGSVLAGLALTLLPYTAYRLFSSASHNTDTNISAGVESLSARAFLGEAKLETFTEVLLTKGSDILVVPIILFCLLSVVYAFRNYKFLLFSLLLSIIPALLVTRSVHSARYLYPFVFLVGIMAAVTAPYLIQKFKKWYFIFLAVAIAACFAIRFIANPYLPSGISIPLLKHYLPALAAGLVAAALLKDKALRLFFIGLILSIVANEIHISEIVRIKNSETSKVAGHLRLTLGKELLREVISTTGWSYEQFRERTFIQGSGRVVDYSFFYRFLSHEERPANAAKFDGLLIRSRLPAQTVIPATLENMFSSGAVSCVKEVTVEHLHLCFYNFKDAASAVRINNIGYGYDFSQPAITEVNSPEGVSSSDANNAVFYFNHCPDFEVSCSVFFRIRLQGKRLHLEVLGDPVATPMTSVNPAFAATLEKPSLAVKCGGTESTFEIAAKIGYDRNKSTLLAPVDGIFDIGCSRPSEVTLIVDRYTKAVKDFAFGKGTPFRLVWKPQ